MKRAVIVHGWGGNPQAGWIPWLKKELEAKNIFVETPEMPHTDTPTIEDWVPQLAKYIDSESENYLIGHSIGCQTILRYLEKLPENVKIKGVVFVAGWITLSDAVMKNPDEAEVARPWVETPINLEKVRASADEFISIFSDNDPFVSEDNWEAFRKLGDLVIQHGNGHIENQQEKDVLNAVLKVMK